eukprot:6185580-Pleurochrysis_carterae.AAC.1
MPCMMRATTRPLRFFALTSFDAERLPPTLCSIEELTKSYTSPRSLPLPPLGCLRSPKRCVRACVREERRASEPLVLVKRASAWVRNYVHAYV